jgi:hypothetical protein
MVCVVGACQLVLIISTCHEKSRGESGGKKGGIIRP